MALSQRTVAQHDTIDLNRVRVFISVVEGGSFTAAALRLGLPKSSISRSVSALEKSLGARLLQRTTRALSLTDAGQTYFQQVRPALESLSESAATVHALGAEPRGRIRVSCSADSEDLLCQYVVRFKKKYPKVQIDLSFSSRHVDLISEGFDLAVRAGVLKDSSLMSRKVLATDLALFASPAYLKRRGAPKSLADLTRHDCIGNSSQTGRAVWTLTNPEGEEQSVEVELAVSADLVQFVGRAAVQGLGIVLMPETFALGLTEVPAGLVRVLPGWKQLGNGLYLVWPSRGYEPKALTLFKEGLMETLSHVNSSACGAISRQKIGGADYA